MDDYTPLHQSIHDLFQTVVVEDGKYAQKLQIGNILTALVNLRALPTLVVARFQSFGMAGYDMTKEELGILHADCSSQNKAVSIGVYFGYQLIAMMNLHTKKGWKHASQGAEGGGGGS